MTQQELVELHAALGVVLSWSAGIREAIGTWLAPEAAQKPGNGVDPHPLPIASTGKVSKLETSAPRRSPAPYAGKARPGKAKAEQKLLAAMRGAPGSTVIALAQACAAGRSVTGERLRRLASRGLVTKDANGQWWLVGDLAGEEARPPSRRRR